MPGNLPDNIPEAERNLARATGDGRSFTLNYGAKTTLSMRFAGQQRSGANAQGWERNSHRFFSQLQAEHPEMFSRANRARIANMQNPIVDRRMIDHNPQFRDYRGDTLVHHHIGGDGRATAIPEGMHRGFGGVHNAEEETGVTDRCRAFSDRCQRALESNPELKGLTPEAMRVELGRMEAGERARARGGAIAGNANAHPASGGGARARANAIDAPAQSPAAGAGANAARGEAISGGAQSPAGRASSGRGSGQSSNSGGEGASQGR